MKDATGLYYVYDNLKHQNATGDGWQTQAAAENQMHDMNKREPGRYSVNYRAPAQDRRARLHDALDAVMDRARAKDGDAPFYTGEVVRRVSSGETGTVIEQRGSIVYVKPDRLQDKSVIEKWPEGATRLLFAASKQRSMK